MSNADRQIILAQILDNGFTVVNTVEDRRLVTFVLSKRNVAWVLTVDTEHPGALLESERLGIQVSQFFQKSLDEVLTNVFARV